VTTPTFILGAKLSKLAEEYSGGDDGGGNANPKELAPDYVEPAPKNEKPDG
jgi:hypothetical protein